MKESWGDGFVNVRDLGGLPTRLSPSGRTTQGRAARGPRRAQRASTGWADAREWGSRTVVDLRRHDDAGPRSGDLTVDLAATAGLTSVAAPTEDHSGDGLREVCFPILDSPACWPHNGRVLPDLVLEALVTISDSSPGVLAHCRADRDGAGTNSHARR